MDLLRAHFNSYGNTTEHICYRTFERLFYEIEAKGCPPLTILETGTAAYGTSSTYLFDSYVRKYGGRFWTVDINPAHSDAVKPHMSDRTTVVTGDSVSFLKEWVKEHSGEQADIVYLDSYDLDFENPEDSGNHGLQEYKAILPALHKGSLLLIDDTPTLSDDFLEEEPRMYIKMRRTYDRIGICPGKGMYVINTIDATLLEHWYQLLYKM
jgi:hypothetical protein